MAKAAIENVSDTAIWVANFRAKEGERPDALFHDPLSAKLAGKRGLELARAMPYPKILGWVMAVRTVAIDRLISEAMAAGVDTVINLGAGLDTRPYRLELPSSLKWVEVDFPHLIDMKNEKLADEKPHCELTRIGLDLSDRPAATRLYAELGARTRKALIVTEGVIPYLTLEAAGQLADDLRAIPGFQFWIQDYRRSHKAWNHPPRLRKKLKNAPFQFQHPDPLSFFGEHGWSVKTNVLSIDEGMRVGRPFPIPFPWKYLARLLPWEKREAFRNAAGYVLLRAGS